MKWLPEFLRKMKKMTRIMMMGIANRADSLGGCLVLVGSVFPAASAMIVLAALSIPV